MLFAHIHINWQRMTTSKMIVRSKYECRLCLWQKSNLICAKIPFHFGLTGLKWMNDLFVFLIYPHFILILTLCIRWLPLPSEINANTLTARTLNRWVGNHYTFIIASNTLTLWMTTHCNHKNYVWMDFVVFVCLANATNQFTFFVAIHII